MKTKTLTALALGTILASSPMLVVPYTNINTEAQTQSGKVVEITHTGTEDWLEVNFVSAEGNHCGYSKNFSPESSGTEPVSAGIRNLMDFIQRFESSGAVKSQGVHSSYQVVFGGIDPTDRPSVALTSMTVSDVLAWQDSIDSLYMSEAAGAYQVMEDTLRGLVDTGHINPEATFNEATQDAVAVLLMERRGLSKFVAGEISAEDFADNLAREWASFPVVRDQSGANRNVKRGQSYYAGDNLNKAHADPNEFLSVVSGILGNTAVQSDDKAQADSKVPEQLPELRETSASAFGSHRVTLGAKKSVDGPIKIFGQYDLVEHSHWSVNLKTEIDTETKDDQTSGRIEYNNKNLSTSASVKPGEKPEFAIQWNFAF